MAGPADLENAGGGGTTVQRVDTAQADRVQHHSVPPVVPMPSVSTVGERPSVSPPALCRCGYSYETTGEACGVLKTHERDYESVPPRPLTAHLFPRAACTQLLQHPSTVTVGGFDYGPSPRTGERAPGTHTAMCARVLCCMLP